MTWHIDNNGNIYEINEVIKKMYEEQKTERINMELILLRSVCNSYKKEGMKKTDYKYYNCMIKCNGYDYKCDKYIPKYNNKLFEGT